MDTLDRKSLVYKGSPPDHNCVDQMLRVLPNGEWAVIFCTGGVYEPERDNHIALCRSSDQGYTWGAAEAVLRYEDLACLSTEAIVHGDTITAFVSTHDGRFANWRNWVIRSADSGHVWSRPAPFAPMPQRTFIRNLCVASWGEWLLPFQTYDTMPDPLVSIFDDSSTERAENGVLITADQGQTWEQSNRIGPTWGWAENNLVELSDGSLVMLVRADRTGHLLRSESSDRGRTWTPLTATDIPTPGTKFRLFRLSDGRIVLLHNPNSQTTHPNRKPGASVQRNPLALWISSDDMRTWGYRRILTDFPGMLAYPDGVVDDREEYLHFAFDYNRHDVIY